MDVICGDKIIVTAGGIRKVWTISAINNQVVKYFDESGAYGQMTIGHLREMIERSQATIMPCTIGD